MTSIPSVNEYVKIQLAATPLAAVASSLDDTREALIMDIGAALRSYIADEGLAFPQYARVAVARH